MDKLFGRVSNGMKILPVCRTGGPDLIPRLLIYARLATYPPMKFDRPDGPTYGHSWEHLRISGPSQFADGRFSLGGLDLLLNVEF